MKIWREGISQKFNINIKIFEPKTNSEKARCRLVYGHNQYMKCREDDINLGMLGGHCFYIKKMDFITILFTLYQMIFELIVFPSQIQATFE